MSTRNHRLLGAILVACAPLVFGCEEKDDGPCGGCSTSRTVSGGGEIPGELSARAEGWVELQGEVATFDATEALTRIDAGPFRLVVSDEDILVYSTLPCTTCDPPADVDAGAEASVPFTVPAPGEPYLVMKLTFTKDAFTKTGTHDAARVTRVQACSEGLLDSASHETCDATFTGTLIVEGTSPRSFVLEVRVEGRGALKLEYVERRGPSTTTPAQVECYGSYG